MKSRIIWIVVVLAALGGFYFATIRPTRTVTPGFSKKRAPLAEFRPPQLPPPPLPQPVITMPTITPPPLPATTRSVTARMVTPLLPPPEVPIQDGTTIDFSYGAPQIKTQGKDQDALEKALKQMAEATKEMKFEPKKQ